MSTLEQEAQRAVTAANPRYRLVSFDEMLTRPPIQWRVKGILPAQGQAQIFGASRSGKSFLAFDLACAIAEGRDWFGHRVEQGPVVYIVLEGQGGFPQRMLAWSLVHDGRKPEHLRLIVEPFQLDMSCAARLIESIPLHSVVFIDTQSRASVGLEENSARDMGLMLEAMAYIAQEVEGVVVSIAHTGTSEDAQHRARGSSAQLAAMDAQIAVHRNGEARSWTLTKSKDGADGQTHHFTLEVVEIGIDDDGDVLTSCVVAESEAPARTASRLTQSVRLAMATYIEACMGGNATVHNGQFIGLHLDTWREVFYSQHTADTQEAKQKAFKRVREKLQGEGLMTVANDVYRITEPSVSIQEGEFIKASGQADNKRTCPDLSGGTTADRHGHTPLGVSGVRCLKSGKKTGEIEPAQTDADSDDDFAEKIIARFEREADR